MIENKDIVLESITNYEKQYVPMRVIILIDNMSTFTTLISDIKTNISKKHKCTVTLNRYQFNTYLN
ncbi:hypothetical protein QTP88_014527 [Uroleucon formosanum]